MGKRSHWSTVGNSYSRKCSFKEDKLPDAEKKLQELYAKYNVAYGGIEDGQLFFVRSPNMKEESLEKLLDQTDLVVEQYKQPFVGKVRTAFRKIPHAIYNHKIWSQVRGDAKAARLYELAADFFEGLIYWPTSAIWAEVLSVQPAELIATTIFTSIGTGAAGSFTAAYLSKHIDEGKLKQEDRKAKILGAISKASYLSLILAPQFYYIATPAIAFADMTSNETNDAVSGKRLMHQALDEKIYSQVGTQRKVQSWLSRIGGMAAGVGLSVALGPASLLLCGLIGVGGFAISEYFANRSVRWYNPTILDLEGYAFDIIEDKPLPDIRTRSEKTAQKILNGFSTLGRKIARRPKKVQRSEPKKKYPDLSYSCVCRSVDEFITKGKNILQYGGVSEADADATIKSYVNWAAAQGNEVLVVSPNYKNMNATSEMLKRDGMPSAVILCTGDYTKKPILYELFSVYTKIHSQNHVADSKLGRLAISLKKTDEKLYEFLSNEVEKMGLGFAYYVNTHYTLGGLGESMNKVGMNYEKLTQPAEFPPITVKKGRFGREKKVHEKVQRTRLLRGYESKLYFEPKYENAERRGIEVYSEFIEHPNPLTVDEVRKTTDALLYREVDVDAVKSYVPSQNRLTHYLKKSQNASEFANEVKIKNVPKGEVVAALNYSPTLRLWVLAKEEGSYKGLIRGNTEVETAINTVVDRYIEAVKQIN